MFLLKLLKNSFNPRKTVLTKSKLIIDFFIVFLYLRIYSNDVAQGQTTTSRKVYSDMETTVDTSLSKESKRQREQHKHISAFGQRAGESDLIFLQGILPEINGDVMNDRSTEEQVGATLDRLELMLSNRGVSLADIMKIEIQVTEIGAAETVDAVYKSRFDDVAFPPRTVVGVDALPGGAIVQLDVIAVEE